MTAVVIADVIASRALDDRLAAQRAMDATIARVDEAYPLALSPLRPTVGDEQQGAYPTLETALASLLLLRLALPEGLEFRFGIGIGDVHVISSADRDIPDGPGWWAARDAIDIVHALQKRTAPTARTWIVAASGEDADMARAVRLANTYVLARDHIIGTMNPRGRRLVYGRCLGATQRELAESENISQSAVSQGLAAAGAAPIVEGFAALTGGTPA